MLRIALLSLGLFMAAAASASADTLSERIAQLEPHVTVTRPEGAGPFPVVVMLHGCGGRRPFLDRYARAAADAGAASVIVDSFAHRRIGRAAAIGAVCTGARLRGRERAGDFYAMLAWTRAQPWADRERLIAAGWSHGAWAIMDGMALRSGDEMRRATGFTDLPHEPLEGLAATFLIYPYVGPPAFGGRRAWRYTPADSIAVVGGRDMVAGTRAPMAAIDRHRARGARIETVIYEKANHAFDDYGALFPPMAYNAEYSRRTEQLLATLVTRTLAP